MEDPFQDLQKDVAAFLSADDPPRRKRGGQPGNQNPRKQVNMKYRFGR